MRNRIDARLALAPLACVLLFFAIAPRPAQAAPAATVWLEGTIEERDGSRTTLRAPLPWLGAVHEGQVKIEFERMKIRPARLLDRYRDLPAGETRLVAEDINAAGEPYRLDVVSRVASPGAAEGKIHLLIDENGKKTDMRFPMSVARALDILGDLLPNWVQVGAGDRSKADAFDRKWDLEGLLSYGPFQLVESRGANENTTVWIE